MARPLELRRPPAISDSPEPSRVIACKGETPQSSSSKVNTPNTKGTNRERHDEEDLSDIDRFHIYRRFRLCMVERFGSLAAAIWELSKEPENGSMSRELWISAVVQQLQLLRHREADAVFSHLTDVEATGIERPCIFSDFDITEDDWRHV